MLKGENPCKGCLHDGVCKYQDSYREFIRMAADMKEKLETETSSQMTDTTGEPLFRLTIAIICKKRPMSLRGE